MASKSKNGKVRAEYAPKIVLVNWRKVVEAIPEMNEYELKAALIHEKKNAKRGDVVFRLARRLALVQAQNRSPTTESLVSA